MTALDLTDTWHGRFTYPRQNAPSSFTAELRQVGDTLTGVIDEPGIGPADGLVLTSSVAGQVAGTSVTLLKTYDVVVAGYSAEVHYEGGIRDEGLEIAGTWSIPGAWSGDFIMIRARGLTRSASRRQTERV